MKITIFQVRRYFVRQSKHLFIQIICSEKCVTSRNAFYFYSEVDSLETRWCFGRVKVEKVYKKDFTQKTYKPVRLTEGDLFDIK